MAPSKLSNSAYLGYAATLFALIWTGFGLNAIFRPRNAFEVFEFDLPAAAVDQKLVDSLMILYGARDLFMGVAVYSATYFGKPKSLGGILIAGGLVALVDGAVCKAQIGRGEWNHWGYAPVVMIVGMLLTGVFDQS